MDLDYLNQFYLEIFCYEWSKTGICIQKQVGILVVHESVKINIAFRADVILGEKLIVEFKSVNELVDLHFKQLSTYLKLANLKLGLLINFNVPLLRDGIHRVANNL